MADNRCSIYTYIYIYIYYIIISVGIISIIMINYYCCYSWPEDVLPLRTDGSNQIVRKGLYRGVSENRGP